jgi:hypothetical protein
MTEPFPVDVHVDALGWRTVIGTVGATVGGDRDRPSDAWTAST